VCYSADGQCVLAGGDSKYICIYEVSERLLIRKFQISHNRSFDGVSDFLNSKSMSDAGPLELIEPDYGSDDELTDLRLPGVKSGPFSNLSSRSTPKTIRYLFIDHYYPATSYLPKPNQVKECAILSYGKSLGCCYGGRTFDLLFGSHTLLRSFPSGYRHHTLFCARKVD